MPARWKLLGSNPLQVQGRCGAYTDTVGLCSVRRKLKRSAIDEVFGVSLALPYRSLSSRHARPLVTRGRLRERDCTEQASRGRGREERQRSDYPGLMINANTNLSYIVVGDVSKGR